MKAQKDLLRRRESAAIVESSMSDSSDGPAPPARSPTDFEKELVELCGVLEQWRAEQKAAEKSKPRPPPFWRALFPEFRTKDNYPFTPLLNGLRIDFSAADRLQPFSTHALIAAQERIALVETELGDRIASIVGSPALLGAFGLLGTIWTVWQNFHGRINFLTMLVLGGAILAFVFAAYGFRLRISLFELARCRALLSLEIARRKGAPASQ